MNSDIDNDLGLDIDLGMDVSMGMDVDLSMDVALVCGMGTGTSLEAGAGASMASGASAESGVVPGARVGAGVVFGARTKASIGMSVDSGTDMVTVTSSKLGTGDYSISEECSGVRSSFPASGGGSGAVAFLLATGSWISSLPAEETLEH